MVVLKAFLFGVKLTFQKLFLDIVRVTPASHQHGIHPGRCRIPTRSFQWGNQFWRIKKIAKATISMTSCLQSCQSVAQPGQQFSSLLVATELLKTWYLYYTHLQWIACLKFQNHHINLTYTVESNEKFVVASGILNSHLLGFYRRPPCPFWAIGPPVLIREFHPMWAHEIDFVTT